MIVTSQDKVPTWIFSQPDLSMIDESGRRVSRFDIHLWQGMCVCMGSIGRGVFVINKGVSKRKLC